VGALVACAEPSRVEGPIVIAHRGASGYAPEHTLTAYALAMLQGADFVEADLVMTRDGVLVARHDNALHLTTDVASRAEFAGRRTTRSVDGVQIADGWFSEDFALAELKRLRAVERLPALRPENRRFDGQFEIPTLQEVIDLVRGMERALGRRIGLYLETKHPSYFASLDLPMERMLVEILHRNGYRERSDPVFIQSFETANLKQLDELTRLALVQLLAADGKPWDIEAASGSLSYEQMATRAGLGDIAAYADAVGPPLGLARTTSFLDDAHAAGLLVHAYTFRTENGSAEKLRQLLEAGIDGLFIDQPDVGVAARDALRAGRSSAGRP
jgi:glycerophosphoryl diester phosphodiesterase